MRGWTAGSSAPSSETTGSRAATKGATSLFSRIRRELVLLSALAGAGLAALGVTVTVVARATRSRVATRRTCPSATSTHLPAASSALRSRHHIPGKPLPTRSARHRAGRQHGRGHNGERRHVGSRPSAGPPRSRPRRSAPPRGLVEIETAYGPTPSVAATIARLRQVVARTCPASQHRRDRHSKRRRPSSWRGIRAGSSTAPSGVSTATRSFRSHAKTGGASPGRFLPRREGRGRSGSSL